MNGLCAIDIMFHGYGGIMPEYRVQSGYSVGVVEARTAELAAFDWASRHSPGIEGKVKVWELKPVEIFYIKTTLSLKK